MSLEFNLLLLTGYAPKATINSTPQLGDHPDSCFGYDLSYMQSWIQKIKPDLICACGKIAQSGCKELGINFVEAPHPAWRRLSKQHTSDIRKEIVKRLK